MTFCSSKAGSNNTQEKPLTPAWRCLPEVVSLVVVLRYNELSCFWAVGGGGGGRAPRAAFLMVGLCWDRAAHKRPKCTYEVAAWGQRLVPSHRTQGDVKVPTRTCQIKLLPSQYQKARVWKTKKRALCWDKSTLKKCKYFLFSCFRLQIRALGRCRHKCSMNLGSMRGQVSLVPHFTMLNACFQLSFPAVLRSYTRDKQFTQPY